MIKVDPFTSTINDLILLQMVNLDKSYTENLGASYTTFTWEKENFLKDIKGKWEHSFIATEEKLLLGFWIASTSVPHCCHTHRVAIDPAARGKGIAKILFEKMLTSLNSQDIQELTVEASATNLTAIHFYNSLEYQVITSSEETKVYLDKRGRTAKIENGIIIEDDESRYVVLKRKCNE